jgi:Protein of unknown function (DUF1703).
MKRERDERQAPNTPEKKRPRPDADVLAGGQQGVPMAPQVGYPKTPQGTPVRRSIVRRLPFISPQQVHIPAENGARLTFEALSTGLDRAQEDGLKVLLNWYQRFPTIFTKIKWFTPEDVREEAQVDFKFKLAGALHHSILSCLAQGSSESSAIGPEFFPGYNSYTSSIRLGGFEIQSVISKADLQARHSIQVVDKGLAVPKYNQDNKIKQAFMNYLFSRDDTKDFQNVLQKLLSAIPANVRIAKEQFYHALVYGMISFMGSSFSIIEAYSGEGRADILLVSDAGLGTGSQNCIIEFKYNHSVGEALDQIESMHYSKYFGSGDVIAVGINIKSRPFTVTCAKKVIRCESPAIASAGDTVSGTVAW